MGMFKAERLAEEEQLEALAARWGQELGVELRQVAALLYALKETIRQAQTRGVRPSEIAITIPSELFRSLKP